ncbi:hypothetical protein AMTR_s00052p00172360 [Amborella trichopoda]|uniref:Uncharacterized protein n=1 Tax=Amborella trichopoda TaxID=13333 RepID=U5D7T5_AMBTC|nr:hypothetical protein AMTR_s00052p00172360 [Amborella trichopoda]
MKHLADNFKKAYRNSALTKLYWKVACALTISSFDELAKIKSILQAREKPLIKLLECLRVKLIGEFSKKIAMSLEWSDVLTPKDQKELDLRRDKSRFFHTVVTWAHDGIYEINADKKYVVNLSGVIVMPPDARRTAGRPKKRRKQTKFKELGLLSVADVGLWAIT